MEQENNSKTELTASLTVGILRYELSMFKEELKEIFVTKEGFERVMNALADTLNSFLEEMRGLRSDSDRHDLEFLSIESTIQDHEERINELEISRR